MVFLRVFAQKNLLTHVAFRSLHNATRAAVIAPPYISPTCVTAAASYWQLLQATRGSMVQQWAGEPHGPYLLSASKAYRLAVQGLSHIEASLDGPASWESGAQEIWPGQLALVLGLALECARRTDELHLDSGAANNLQAQMGRVGPHWHVHVITDQPCT